VKLSKYRAAFVFLLVLIGGLTLSISAQVPPSSLQGVLRDSGGKVLAGAEVKLTEIASGQTITVTTDAQGAFNFSSLTNGSYTLQVHWQELTARPEEPLRLQPGDRLTISLRLEGSGVAVVETTGAGQEARASGGQKLSSRQVSALPLNKRDFSQLLLLAAGTMTDTNGSANFTQQFSVNGQRGTASMFAMDSVDTTDPELGGATFTNFNVDAVQEIQSLSGVMPPEIGHGAAGFTNIKTKAGTEVLHGSVFEFVRNSAFDARNFFDERTIADPDRIPPFRRNEFGFALGGPVKLPGTYNGRDRTFFFGQYQGFRQVLGTTQILSVPTAAERQGFDTTAYPGDTLYVPVDPQVAKTLAAYPPANDPQGSFGLRTYATSSKVTTDTNQFSIRIDHKVGDKGLLFGRFTFNNTNGPLTNPSQSAIDPSFAVLFHDHQRNLALEYTGALSPRWTTETSLGYIRSTPLFISPNYTQPAMTFADSLYEPFNSAAGTATGSYGNVYQLRQNIIYTRGTHAVKFGFEMRFNRDSTVFGLNPDGTYVFGGGPAYATTAITSASGQHNIQPGSPLPDTLTGFLTATPFSYNTTVPQPFTPGGDHFDECNIRREAYNFFFQDAWKVTARFSLTYGLRYEASSRFHEGANRTATPVTLDANGNPAPFWAAGAHQIVEVDPQPPYGRDLNGWGPRLSAEWRAADHTVLRAGGGITTMLPNLWFDNFLTGAFPFMVDPDLTAAPGVAVPFSDSVTRLSLPPLYAVGGQLVFPNGATTSAHPNTQVDVQRFQSDLEALIPGHQPQPLYVFGMYPGFRNGYIGNYTAGIEQTVKDVVLSASYVAAIGVKLASTMSPNSYAGASPEFAPFSEFNSAGQIVGGFSQELMIGSPSHSTYHSLQLSATKNSPRLGLGFQSSYTVGKALDDTSAVATQLASPAGTVIQAPYQNPWDPGADKGPSTFDMAQAFTASAIQMLPLERLGLLHHLGSKVTSGWQLLGIASVTTGSPFTVYSGIQQTGVGSGGGDRPDEIARPSFSTRRTVREDYFGRGADNGSFFSIPIDVPDGTGPNQGRFGTLGRDTFRGPGLHDLDAALIKDTSFGDRAGAGPANLEFRAEFFNCFNLVNFALPVNIIHASGFGVINHTAGTSRQIQFSLKLIF
jgi:hypothetical protein